jgi:hypothetical protein
LVDPIASGCLGQRPELLTHFPFKLASFVAALLLSL